MFETVERTIGQLRAGEDTRAQYGRNRTEVRDQT